MIKWARSFQCRAGRAAAAFSPSPLYLLDFAGCARIDAAVYEWQIAVWYPNNVWRRAGGPSSVFGKRGENCMPSPPPRRSQWWWIGFNIEWKAKMGLVIKERKRELALNLFSGFVSVFLSLAAFWTRPDNVDVWCPPPLFFSSFAAALQDVFSRLSNLTY